MDLLGVTEIPMQRTWKASVGELKLGHTTTLPHYHLIVFHELFLLAMFLHGCLNCYMCYLLNEDFHNCVKSTQFLVKLVAGV